MINFEDEIAKFKPSREISATEDAIVRSDMTDMQDLVAGILREAEKAKFNESYQGM